MTVGNVRRDAENGRPDKIALRCVLLLLCAVAAPAGAGPSPDTELPAFPGAEGFGAFARGGRGGKAFCVTSLADKGPGTLREAVDAKGPRMVVFRVSGIIDLKSSIRVSNPFITIAGQTAPGDGICLRGGSFLIDTDEVVVRFLRVRLGHSGRGGDAISIGRGRNVIVDHCSASWSLDEVLSCSTGAPEIDNVTVQWCFITEALNPKNHGFGSLIRGCRGARYTFHHNLYAHNRGRNPRPGNYDRQNPHTEDPEGLLLDFRNNAIYNWAGRAAGYNADKNSVTRLNYVGNYLVPGPNSSRRGMAYSVGSTYNRGYFAGNWFDGILPQDPWSLVDFGEWSAEQVAAYRRAAPFETGPIETQEAPDAYRDILRHGGASLPKRDAVDERIVRDVEKRTGRIINSESEIGGWPTYQSASPPIDSDSDGMPDEWETKFGLDANDASDGAGDKDRDGYTNVEEWLNGTDPTQFIEKGKAETKYTRLESRWRVKP